MCDVASELMRRQAKSKFAEELLPFSEFRRSVMRLAGFALSSAAAKKNPPTPPQPQHFVSTKSKPLNQWLCLPIARLRTQQAAASRTVKVAMLSSSRHMRCPDFAKTP